MFLHPKEILVVQKPAAIQEKLEGRAMERQVKGFDIPTASRYGDLGDSARYSDRDKENWYCPTRKRKEKGGKTVKTLKSEGTLSQYFSWRNNRTRTTKTTDHTIVAEDPSKKRGVLQGNQRGPIILNAREKH